MLIVIIQGAFLPVPPIRGGAVEKIWFAMGKEFALLGHEVIHISRSVPELPDFEVSNNVKHIRIKGFDTPSNLLKLKTLDLLYSVNTLRKIPAEADVIITNTFWLPIIIHGKMAKKIYVDVQRVPKGQMKFYKHAGLLRACSPAIYNAIKAEIPLASHHRVSYVPNPVPFKVKPVDLKREKIILFVGRLHPEKGVHILLKAFSLLNKELTKDWKLIIVGPSDFKDGGGGDIYFKELLKLTSGIDVELAGPKYNEEELIAYYARSSIFCYPVQGESGDAAPVAPREAMAYGCVPIVSELKCFNDFIENEKNGLTYNHTSDNQENILVEKISLLINDSELLKKMSEECKLVNERFSPDVVAKAFIKDFEKIKQSLKL